MIETIAKRLQTFADERDWEHFHSPKNLVMALLTEAGELSEQFQWLTAMESENLSADKLRAVEEEIADVFIYVIRLSDKLGINLLEVAVKMGSNRIFE